MEMYYFNYAMIKKIYICEDSYELYYSQQFSLCDLNFLLYTEYIASYVVKLFSFKSATHFSLGLDYFLTEYESEAIYIILL